MEQGEDWLLSFSNDSPAPSDWPGEFETQIADEYGENTTALNPGDMFARTPAPATPAFTIGTPLKPYGFDGSLSNQNEPPSQVRAIVASSSPESSSQESSSDSSGRGRKRKSSSISNPYDMLQSPLSPRAVLDASRARDHQGTSSSTFGVDRDIQGLEHSFHHGFPFKNQSSPQNVPMAATIAPSQLLFNHSPPVDKKSQWLFPDSEDSSPNIAISTEGSPTGTFDGVSPRFVSPAPLNGTQTSANANHTSPWQQPHFSGSTSGPSSSPAANPALSFVPTRRESRSEFAISLRAQPNMWKSRVETQIGINLFASALPGEIRKLHLPPESIARAKLFAEESDVGSAPDTLELHTSLVCSTPMEDPKLRRMALLRAQGVHIKSEATLSPAADNDDNASSSTNNDPTKPMNGGEVRICDNCERREKKRGERKSKKRQEDDDRWLRYAKDRIIIFNTKEYQEWQPINPALDTGENGVPLPEGTKKIHLPMRIACYCRHQQERNGFQVIFTLKDHLGTTIAQTMMGPILTTDDHKTNGTSQFPAADSQDTPTAIGLHRPYHSVNDLQGLTNSQPQFHHHQPPQNPGQRQDSVSQTTSGTMTPHSYQSVSRQASPSAQAGPNKRRKGGSSHHRLPSNLTMTRLDTAQTTSINMPDAISAAPINSAFTSPSAPFMRTNDMMGATMAMAMPATSPTNSITMNGHLRNQSGENLHSFYSVPNSAQHSRSGSPIGFRSGPQMATFQQQQLNSANAYGHFGASQNMMMDIQQPPRVPAPFSLQVLPNQGSISGGNEVTVLGKNFTQTSEVLFGDIIASPLTFWGPTTIVCLTPPGLRTGAVRVTVRDPHNAAFASQGQNASNKGMFTYTDDADAQLLEVALRIMTAKHRGGPEELSNMLNQILDSDRNWSSSAGGSLNGNYHRQHNAMGLNGKLSPAESESLLLRCLDTIDLVDSGHRPQYNMTNKSGSTMLSLACMCGYNRLVAGLLARNVDPETRDVNGYTPLMMASLRGHVQIVRRLLRTGADPALRSLQGYLAYDLACTREIADALGMASPRNIIVGDGGRIHSRVNSLASLHSIWDTPSPSQDSRRSSKVATSETATGGSDDSNGIIPPFSSQAWIQSRRNSVVVLDPLTHGASPHDQARFPSPSEYMAALTNHFSAHLQQFQQSYNNWNLPNFTNLQLPALPPMNLPDYQAHPMVRRISSLVPQRAAPQSGDESAAEVAGWRNPFSSLSLPPAYEEIYPEGNSKSGGLDMKKGALLEAAADAALDQKCAAIFDVEAEASKTSDKGMARLAIEDSDTDLDVRIGKRMLTREEQEKMKRAHAKKLKKIRSDRNLFMIWIPLLLIVLAAMSKNQLFDVFAFAVRYMQQPQQPQQAPDATMGRIVEVA